MESFFKILTFLLFLGAVGCASKLIVLTLPQGATVFMSTIGGEKKNIGQTPLEISDAELRKQLRLEATGSQFIEVSLELNNFESTRFLLPSNRWGQKRSLVKFSLNPQKEPVSKQVNDLINRIYASQKLVETRQYELALVELNKVFEIDPKIVQAHALKGAILYIQNKLPESLLSYKEALRLDAQYIEAIKMIEKIEQRKPGSVN